MKTTLRQRFTITQFTNAGGSVAWRVSGIRRDGSRVRANYADADAAKLKAVELEAEYYAREPDAPGIRATRLNETQVKLAELVFPRLADDADIVLAVDAWLRHGKQQSAKVDAPRLDDAVRQFKAWLDGEPFDGKPVEGEPCTLRDLTRTGLKTRVKMFADGVSNCPVSDITPDMVFDYLAKRDVAKVSRDNDRRALSRFFGWCIGRPRRWITTNPARKETRERRNGNGKAPTILTVAECEKLLRASESRGLAAYVAVCLFGGVRPFEASRLTAAQVNLRDREIRLTEAQTKTGRSRVVAISDTLAEWLKRYKKEKFFPSNWRKTFDAVKAAAGFGPDKDVDGKATGLKPWPVDVMRHTAISHYFRKTGSYGQTAEQFGNSEAIIKAHYQGRVTTDETKKFYAIKPSKKGGKK